MVALFTSGLPQVLFSIAVFVWWVSEFVGATILPKLRDRGHPSVRRDRGSGFVIIFSVWVAVFVSYGLGYFGIGPLPDAVFYPGLFLMMVGVIIRQWAIVVLGRFFSLSVRITEGHSVVDKGPYRYVRHPSYTGALLTFMGLGLAVQSWAAVLLLLVMFIVAYGYRMLVEERALKSELGAD